MRCAHESFDSERHVRLLGCCFDGEFLERTHELAVLEGADAGQGNPFWMVALPAVGASRLVFVDVVDAKTVKNRIHLDLVPEDASQDQEVDRILSLGARIIDDRRQATPGGWVVMADPQGNEFCVEGGG